MMNNKILKIYILAVIILLLNICLSTPVFAEWLFQEYTARLSVSIYPEHPIHKNPIVLEESTYVIVPEHQMFHGTSVWDFYGSEDVYVHTLSHEFVFVSSTDSTKRKTVVPQFTPEIVWEGWHDNEVNTVYETQFGVLFTYQELKEYLDGLIDEDKPEERVGDPINVITGNMHTTFTDISINSLGPALAFERMYRSRSSYAGVLGYGWNHSFNQFLMEDAFNNVIYFAISGSNNLYSYNEGGAYTSLAKDYSELVKNADNDWTIIKKDGTKYNFNTPGEYNLQSCPVYLSSIEDRNGNELTLTYTDYLLTSVTDAAGRQLTLSYDAESRIETVTDPAVNSVNYSYDANGDLVSFTDRQGNQTTYTYDSNHNMVQIKDAEDRSTYFSYDENDRATGSWTDNDYYKVTRSYDPDNMLTQVTGSDNPPLIAELVSDVSHGNLTLNPDGSFVYEPDPGYVGPDSFTYKANDGTEDTDVVTVNITVTE